MRHKAFVLAASQVPPPLPGGEIIAYLDSKADTLKHHKSAATLLFHKAKFVSIMNEDMNIEEWVNRIETLLSDEKTPPDFKEDMDVLFEATKETLREVSDAEKRVVLPRFITLVTQRIMNSPSFTNTPITRGFCNAALNVEEERNGVTKNCVAWAVDLQVSETADRAYTPSYNSDAEMPLTELRDNLNQVSRLTLDSTSSLSSSISQDSDLASSVASSDQTPRIELAINREIVQELLDQQQKILDQEAASKKTTFASRMFQKMTSSSKASSSKAPASEYGQFASYAMNVGEVEKHATMTASEIALVQEQLKQDDWRPLAISDASKRILGGNTLIERVLLEARLRSANPAVESYRLEEYNPHIDTTYEVNGLALLEDTVETGFLFEEDKQNPQDEKNAVVTIMNQQLKREIKPFVEGEIIKSKTVNQAALNATGATELSRFGVVYGQTMIAEAGEAPTAQDIRDKYEEYKTIYPDDVEGHIERARIEAFVNNAVEARRTVIEQEFSAAYDEVMGLPESAAVRNQPLLARDKLFFEYVDRGTKKSGLKTLDDYMENLQEKLRHYDEFRQKYHEPMREAALNPTAAEGLALFSQYVVQKNESLDQIIEHDRNGRLTKFFNTQFQAVKGDLETESIEVGNRDFVRNQWKSQDRSLTDFLDTFKEKMREKADFIKGFDAVIKETKVNFGGKDANAHYCNMAFDYYVTSNVNLEDFLKTLQENMQPEVRKKMKSDYDKVLQTVEWKDKDKAELDALIVKSASQPGSRRNFLQSFQADLTARKEYRDQLAKDKAEHEKSKKESFAAKVGKIFKAKR